MNINDAFPSSYLKAADLGPNRPTVTITEVKYEDIGGEHKPVVYFAGKDRGLVLNKTNANSIIEIAGSPVTEDWAGVKIVLFATKTEFQGKRVDCIRIDAPVGQPRAINLSKKSTPPPAPEYDGVPDDDIPF